MPNFELTAGGSMKLIEMLPDDELDKLVEMLTENEDDTKE